jgi:hypothetical protein
MNSFLKIKFKLLLPLFFLPLFFISCREPKTAVSCSGVNQSGTVPKNNSGDPKKKHFMRRQKKSKGQDGFVQKDRKTRRSAKKAEKGKKKERDETKVERKWHLLRKNREAKNDVDAKEKGNSRRNQRQQKKLKKKRMKHPQNGNPPKGQV